MSVKKIYLVFFVCTIIIVFSLNLYFFPSQRKSNKVLEEWITENNTMAVKVTAYAEDNNIFVPGAYYVFSYSAINKKEYIEVMTFRHDDPISIPRENVRFVGDKISYMFIGWKYAVTINSGETWVVWDAKKDWQDWKCCNYSLIKDVEINQDGNGKMYINIISDNRNEVPVLYTKNYGQTWSILP